jgi:putative hydrolase of the HAD superfamily
MAIRAVIFDLYGVLGLNGWQAFKTQHFAGREAAWERLRALGQQADTGKNAQSAFVSAVAQATGQTEQTIRYQFEHTVANTSLFEFIAAELHGRYKLAILSNTSADVFADIFTPSQRALFDEVISSHQTGLAKPDPQMFLLACGRLGLEPAECLMVDDKAEHVAAARTLGMPAVRYANTAQATHDIMAVLEQ